MIYRSVLSDLEQWHNKANRKPLVLRGARQVGKSTLVRMFAKQNGLDLVELNLEKFAQLDKVFKTLDVKSILNEISGLTAKSIKGENTILFLDEIQATPHALAALRYFYEERPGLAVIAAGSLLEFVLSKHEFSMPVGRISYLFLGPVSFNEYLKETHPDLQEYIENYHMGDPFVYTVHERLEHLYREYMFVGGMPEIIQNFIDGADFIDIQQQQQEILNTYIDDFAKYARETKYIRLQKVFRLLPNEVGKKVKYARIASDENAREIRECIELLEKAGLITRVVHSHANGIPLAAESELKTFKLLYLDTGLLNRLNGFDWLYFSKMQEQAIVNEGAIAEQCVGQELLWNSDASYIKTQLFYWLREGRASNAEIDFLTSQGDCIVPIEIKSGKSGSMKSLFQFCELKKRKFAIRFDMNPPNYQEAEQKLRLPKQMNQYAKVKIKLQSLPLYMASQTQRLIREYRESL